MAKGKKGVPLKYIKHPDGYMVGITNKGEEFMFNENDLDKVYNIVWNIQTSGYVQGYSKGGQVLFHRFILDLPKSNRKDAVDHINKVRTDNRRENLRVCSYQQNSSGRKAMLHISEYKGVGYDKRRKNKPWTASICKDWKDYWLGYFNTEQEAALAYNKKAIELYGEYAYLNVIKK